MGNESSQYYSGSCQSEESRSTGKVIELHEYSERYAGLSDHQKKQRQALGLEVPEPPEYNYTAYAILKAFNTIARARKYEQGVPLALGATEIGAYLELYEVPCELHILVECVFTLDNKHLDKAHKRVESRAKK